MKTLTKAKYLGYIKRRRQLYDMLVAMNPDYKAYIVIPRSERDEYEGELQDFINAYHDVKREYNTVTDLIDLQRKLNNSTIVNNTRDLNLKLYRSVSK